MVGIIDGGKTFIAINENTGSFHGKRLFEMMQLTNVPSLAINAVPIIDKEHPPIVSQFSMICIYYVIDRTRFLKTKKARA